MNTTLNILGKVVLSIVDQRLRDTCSKLLTENTAFTLWPASLSHHHAYCGGLLEHTLEVTELAEHFANHSRFPVHSRDCIIASCLWHDYAKTREYILIPEDRIPEDRRSLPAFGRMMWAKSPEVLDGGHPHVSWSYEEFLNEAVNNHVSEDTIRIVRHCILSHHGRAEWGAVEEPETFEAEIVHIADMMSARYGRVK